LIDSAEMREPKLRVLLAYWNDKRGTRAMPARADIDPLDVPPILPNIVLVDVTGDPPRFRFRVVGTDIVFRYGAELTGRDLEQADLGTELGSVRSQYEETTRERVPTYCRHQIETGGRQAPALRAPAAPARRRRHACGYALGGVYAISSDIPIERQKTPPGR
jgi:hypothetical protein